MNQPNKTDPMPIGQQVPRVDSPVPVKKCCGDCKNGKKGNCTNMESKLDMEIEKLLVPPNHTH